VHERERTAEQFVALLAAHVAEELHGVAIDVRLDLLAEVGFIVWDAGHLQAHAGALRDLDREMGAFLGVEAREEDEIAAGPIDERVDFEIVRRIAEGEGNVVLVGPIERIDPVVLPRRPNLHFTGALEESEAAAFSAGFDVAIEPFVRDEAADEGAEAEPS